MHPTYLLSSEFPVVSHDEKTIFRNLVWKHAGSALKCREKLGRISRLGRACGVFLCQARAIDPNTAITNINCFAGKSDYALDYVRLLAANHMTKNDERLPIHPRRQWYMQK